MSTSFSIIASITLCLIVVVICSKNPKISDCPEACSCENSFCRRRRGVFTCTGVAVDCYAKNLTNVPVGIPSNVTGLLLSSNGLRAIELGDFLLYTRLTDLLIDSNNATSLRIAKPFRKLKRLSLRDNKLFSLPRKNLTFLKNLQQLLLEGNQIQDIAGVRFPKKLEVLNLNDNFLTSLASGCFRNSKALRVLKINNNQILRFNSVAFKDLKNLEVLELGGNRLQELQKDAFAPLANGFYLNLKANQISDVHSLSFRYFGSKNQNHHQISLEYNRLQFIDTMLQILTSRKRFYSFFFGGNPIFCDCNLINFMNESSQLVGDSHKMLCASPNTHIGTRVRDLRIEECCF